MKSLLPNRVKPVGTAFDGRDTLPSYGSSTSRSFQQDHVRTTGFRRRSAPSAQCRPASSDKEDHPPSCNDHCHGWCAPPAGSRFSCSVGERRPEASHQADQILCGTTSSEEHHRGQDHARQQAHQPASARHRLIVQVLRARRAATATPDTAQRDVAPATPTSHQPLRVRRRGKCEVVAELKNPHHGLGRFS